MGKAKTGKTKMNNGKNRWRRGEDMCRITRWTVFALLVWISGAGAQEDAGDRDVARALRVYAPMLKAHPEGALVQAGYDRLRQNDVSGAMAAFREALARRDDFAPAHYGMALTAFRSGPGEQGAFVQQTRYHAERAAGLFPDFEGPYRLLGHVHLEILEDYARSVDAYVRSLEAEATMHPEVLQQVARAYVRTGALDEMDEAVVDSLLVSGRAMDLLPVVAQACMGRQSPDLAARYFGRYFASLPLEERQFYQDIRLIASRDELLAYEKTSEDAEIRREFLARFWAGRDPDLMTQANERQIEHYRRVWFARMNFSRSVQPWDRRGEVYIRYGAPEYRSRSDRPAPPMSAAVERIKERVSVELYGEEGAGEVSSGPTFPILIQTDPGMNFPDFPPPDVQSGTAPLQEAVTSDPVLGQEPLPPDVQAALRGEVPYEVTLASRYGQVDAGMDVSAVRWESWVYTGIAGGIEVVFTDQWGGGRFDYAPVPSLEYDKTDAVSRMGRLVTASPQMVMGRSIAQMPEYYFPGGQEAFQDFYYDRAGFRGQDGKTRVEIYYGMSPKSLTSMTQGDTAYVYAGCAAAAFDPVSGASEQAREDALYLAFADVPGAQGNFIPNQLNLALAPGTYELRVQVKDMLSGKSGIYKERLDVEDFGGSDLRLSDLQMGWRILSKGGGEKYRKADDVWVLPMTTKAYRKGQSPLVYYEVYNLSRDSFGQSRFRLDYTVQYEPEKGGGLGRFMASVGRMFRSEGTPEISVSAEQVRAETDLKEYFELNLQKVKGGVNRLTVAVTDLSTGASVQKDVLFRFE